MEENNKYYINMKPAIPENHKKPKYRIYAMKKMRIIRSNHPTLHGKEASEFLMTKIGKKDKPISKSWLHYIVFTVGIANEDRSNIIYVKLIYGNTMSLVEEVLYLSNKNSVKVLSANQIHGNYTIFDEKLKQLVDNEIGCYDLNLLPEEMLNTYSIRSLLGYNHSTCDKTASINFIKDLFTSFNGN